MAARSVVAEFDDFDEGVLGTVEFRQGSEEDPVYIDVDLSGLNSLAGGYHVHTFPISSGCGAASTGGHLYDLATGSVGIALFAVCCL